jgi:RimJ/RimL family protein N-acetyltransferase
VPAELVLRPATPDDEARLLEWRNEPAVREGSFTQETVLPEEHASWFGRKLADPDVRVLIVEHEGRPVGQVRLERSDGEAEVHISLSGEARGGGLGSAALELAAEAARRQLGVDLLVARIRPDNERSIRAFRAAGFVETEPGQDPLWMVRRL